MANPSAPRKGYTCPDCKTFHEFGAWVYAHWTIELRHRCNCGVTNDLLEGEVINTTKENESKSK